MSDNNTEFRPTEFETDTPCKACVAVEKIFGDRFRGCADISNGLAKEYVKLCEGTINEMLADAATARMAGRVTQEEFDLAVKTIKESFSIAVAKIPALAVFHQYGTMSPPVIFDMIGRNLSEIVVKSIERAAQSGENPLGILLDALKMTPAEVQEVQEIQERVNSSDDDND